MKKTYSPQLTLINPGSQPPTARDRSLSEAIQEYLRLKKRKEDSTLKTYASVLKRYLNFVGDDHWPPTWQGILNWIDELERDKLAESTIHSYWLQLRTGMCQAL